MIVFIVIEMQKTLHFGRRYMAAQRGECSHTHIHSNKHVHVVFAPSLDNEDPLTRHGKAAHTKDQTAPHTIQAHHIVDSVGASGPPPGANEPFRAPIATCKSEHAAAGNCASHTQRIQIYECKQYIEHYTRLLQFFIAAISPQNTHFPQSTPQHTIYLNCNHH